jgi:hypothetical protein
MQSFNKGGVPLIPDIAAMKTQALTAVARPALHQVRNAGKPPQARHHYSDDRDVELVLRAPVSPGVNNWSLDQRSRSHRRRLCKGAGSC